MRLHMGEAALVTYISTLRSAFACTTAPTRAPATPDARVVEQQVDRVARVCPGDRVRESADLRPVGDVDDVRAHPDGG